MMRNCFVSKALAGLMLLMVSSCNNGSNPAKPQVDNLGPFGKDLSKPDLLFDSLPKLWIKPMWSKTSSNQNMDIFDTCGSGQSDEQKGLSMVPAGVTAIRLESPGNYIANVRIFDKDSSLIKEYVQQFGYCGELANMNRQTPNGYLSFIGWNGKTSAGIESQEKVLVWNIGLIHKDGSSETKIISIENKKE
jgi:hypothetical protein